MLRLPIRNNVVFENTFNSLMKIFISLGSIYASFEVVIVKLLFSAT